MSSPVSIITDVSNRLTKNFSLDADGKLIKTAAEHLVSGTIETRFLDAQGLKELIPNLSQTQCLCLGQLKDFSQPQPLKCNVNANGAATRSKAFLDFRTDQSWLLLDFDNTGLTPEQAIEILITIDPQFSTADLVVCPSSSSYLYGADGTEYYGPGNYHIWAALRGNPAEYGMLLFNRLVLKDHGFPKVTASGTIIIGTIIDRSVLSPEREIFSANPVLSPGLISKRLENIAYQEGQPIEQSKLAPLNPEEEIELRELFVALREMAVEESKQKRKLYDKKRAQKRAQVNGTTEQMEMASINNAPVYYDKQGRPILELTSDEVIYDNSGKEVFVREFLLDPRDGEKLPDPIEPFVRGDESKGMVGKGVATALGNIIYSHHHGGIIFLLRWSAADLIEFLLDPTSSIDQRKFVWKMISTNGQELSASTTDSEMSEVADAFKHALGNIPGAGVGKEKKLIQKKVTAPSPPAELEDPLLLKFNSKYGIADMSGKAVVLYQKWRKDLNIFDTEVSNPYQQDLMHKGDQVQSKGQYVSAFKYWETQPERNQFTGVCFEPDPTLIRKPGVLPVIQQGGEYNMWMGYIADFEKAKEPTLILKHLEEVWCGGNKEEYEYVLNWFAFLYQNPGKVSTTALVLQSVPGTGKNLWIDGVIVKSFGIHALSTANRDDLTGRFNKHLGLNCFLFSNESTYAGEKADRSMLKSLLTDEFRNIEPKGVDKIRARNCSSAIFASNYSWVVALESNDRRFFYLSVSSHKVGDKGYFKALADEIEGGGRDGFVKLMLERDISDFDITKIPQVQNTQRTTDFLRTAHAAIRMIYALVDVDEDLDVFVEHVAFKRIKEWKYEDRDLYLSRDQLFELFRIYVDRYQLNRQYEDTQAVIRELEVANVLALEGKSDRALWRDRVNGKSVIRFLPVKGCRQLLQGR